MIIKHKSNGKWVVWSGFSHQQLSEEFNTLKEAEDCMNKMERNLQDEAVEEMHKLIIEQDKLKNHLQNIKK